MVEVSCALHAGEHVHHHDQPEADAGVPPVSSWIRAFLALGLLYAVTSAFTLAKCVRDNHEANTVVHRVDEARLEKFLTEYDPLRTG